MTKEEITVSGLIGEYKVDGRPLREFGFAVLELKPFAADVYTLKLQLAGENSPAGFTFPASELHKSALTRHLPVGLSCDLAKHFDSPLSKLIRSRTAL
jgi:hypothetical protein